MKLTVLRTLFASLALLILDNAVAQDTQRVVVTAKRMMDNTASTVVVGVRSSGGKGESGGGNANPGTKAKPATPNNTEKEEVCDEAGTSPATGNPVIVATGEKYKEEPDFIGENNNALSLTRIYRSKNAQSYFFGANWLTDFDPMRISVGPGSCIPMDAGCYPPSLTLHFPGGASYQYLLDEVAWDGTYTVLRSASMGSLFYNPIMNSYLLTKDKRTYRFNNLRRLTQVNGSQGMLYKYNYHATTGQLSSIQNAAGQLMSFTWTSNKVSQIVDPANKIWKYEYNGSGMLYRVTSPASDPDIRLYHYENANAALLTGITINGTRYSTYKYDTSGRVTESGLATGEARDTFSYSGLQTTVTNAAGLSSVHTFTGSAATGLKITGISNAATASCPAAAAITAYDTNGYIDYRLDSNNNKTDYTYDAAGKLKLRIAAAGTPVATSEAYTWVDDDMTQVDYRNASGVAYARIVYSYFTTGLAKGRVQTETRYDLKTSQTQTISYAYTFHTGGVMASHAQTVALGTANATTTWNFDSLGNLTSITNPLNQVESWSGHNGRGQPTQHTAINGAVTTFAYDDKGNRTSAVLNVAGVLRTTLYAYNHDRQLTDTTLPTGQVLRYRYDAAGKLLQVGDAANDFVSRTWTAATNTGAWKSTRMVPALSGAVPAGSASGQFIGTTQLDSLGRPWIEKGNAGQQIKYTRDGNGNILTRTDAANRVTTYTYDAQNRVSTMKAPDDGGVQYGYDTDGRLKTVKDPRLLTTTYTYNGWGKVLTKVSPDTGQTTYTYDIAGRMLTETRANNLVVTYTWDALNRMTSRSVNGATEHYNYDGAVNARGRLTSIADGTGQTVFNFNSAGELIQQVATITAVSVRYPPPLDEREGATFVKCPAQT